jgi:hypothetical protein
MGRGRREGEEVNEEEVWGRRGRGAGGGGGGMMSRHKLMIDW